MIDLYVDDTRPCPEGWILARTIAQAKEWLKAKAVDRLALDHDMGACDECLRNGKGVGEGYFLWCTHEEDGTKLVRWMIDTGYWSRQKPTVHSANPVGALRMREMIDRYWKAPIEQYVRLSDGTD
jgi:hypothetical protein